MTDLALGINLWSQSTSWPAYLDAARRIDRLGYRSLWTVDHLYAPFGDPLQDVFEGYLTLGAWATATTQVDLGLMVGANTFRNPALATKMATTLDHASGGRAVLGLGGAWFEIEHRAYGFDFGRSMGERLDWLDEAAGAARALLDGGTVTSPAGGRYAFDQLTQNPRPLRPHVPIMIGGQGRTKTLRTVARYADIWNATGDPVEVRELDGVLREHCAKVGRDEREIRRTMNHWFVIRDDARTAERAWAAMMAHNRMDLAASLQPARLVMGTPEQVAERILEYVDAGFAEILAEMPTPFDIETMERLIGEVKPLVDRG